MTDTLTQKFTANWEKNKNLFGSIPWKNEPDFLYYIEALLPLETIQKLLIEQDKLYAKVVVEGGEKIKAENLHVTLALPGRLGTHFQKNDIRYMQKTLGAIFQNMPPIPFVIRNFNVFPSVLFAEVYDPSHRLQSVHEAICDEIPFSQHPEFRYQNFLPHVSLRYGGHGKIKAEDRTFAPIEGLFDTIHFGCVQVEQNTINRKILAQYHLK